MHEQQPKPTRPEVTPYSSDDVARRAYFKRTSGEVQLGTVTGEAIVGDKLYYEVAFPVEDGDVATKLIPQEVLDSFDAEERERQFNARPREVGAVALNALTVPPEQPFHDPESNAIPREEVNALVEEAERQKASSGMIEVPVAWRRKPRGE